MRRRRREREHVPAKAEAAAPGAAARRPSKYWPPEDELPQVYHKRTPQPCPECRRVYLEDWGQAVICISSGSDVAWFRCKACGKRFCLPVAQG